MKILVDTHIILWHVEGNSKLPGRWRELLEDSNNVKIVSVGSLWEIAIKVNIGKLVIKYPIDKIVPLDFQQLDINVGHLQVYQNLPLYHRDPFDRLLIAQSIYEDIYLITDDGNMPLYEVKLME